MVAVKSLKTSWKKRQLERAEKKALQEYVRELRIEREEEENVKKQTNNRKDRMCTLTNAIPIFRK